MSPVNVGTGYVDVRPDMSGFNREIRTGVNRGVGQAGQEATRSFRSTFAGIGRMAAGIFAGVQIKSFFQGAVSAASDLNEEISKSNTVFKANGAAIEAWAASGAENFGLSKRAALEAAGTFGNMFSQLGIGSGQAAEMSQSIVELAADFASFQNADISQVIQAQSAAFRGEYDALQRFLPLINAATVEQKALELTGKATAKELTAQEKALAVNALMFEGAGEAAGDFERTSDGLANQQRIVTAEWENAKAELGEGLMPVLVEVTQVLSEHVIPVFKDLFSLEGDAQSFGSKLRDFFADLGGFFLGMGQQVLRAVANLADLISRLPFTDFGAGVRDELRAAADGVDEMRDTLHMSKAEFQELNPEINASKDATKGFAETSKDAVGPISGVGDAVSDTAAAYEELRRNAAAARRDLAGAERDLADAQRGEQEAAAALAEAETAAEALGGLDTAQEEVARKAEDLRDAQDNVADAHDRVADAQDDVKDADSKFVQATAAFVAASQQRKDAVGGVNDELDRYLELANAVVNPALNPLAAGPILPGVDPTTNIFAAGPTLPSVDPAVRPGVAGPIVPGTTVVNPAINPAAAGPIIVNITQTDPDPQHVAHKIMWAIA